MRWARKPPGWDEFQDEDDHFYNGPKVNARGIHGMQAMDQRLAYGHLDSKVPRSHTREQHLDALVEKIMKLQKYTKSLTASSKKKRSDSDSTEAEDDSEEENTSDDSSNESENENADIKLSRFGDIADHKHFEHAVHAIFMHASNGKKLKYLGPSEIINMSTGMDHFLDVTNTGSKEYEKYETMTIEEAKSLMEHM